MAVSIDLLNFYHALSQRSCDAINAMAAALNTFYACRGFILLNRKVDFHCINPPSIHKQRVCRVNPFRTHSAEDWGMQCSGMTTCNSAWNNESMRLSKPQMSASRQSSHFTVPPPNSPKLPPTFHFPHPSKVPSAVNTLSKTQMSTSKRTRHMIGLPPKPPKLPPTIHLRAPFEDPPTMLPNPQKLRQRRSLPLLLDTVLAYSNSIALLVLLGPDSDALSTSKKA